MGVGTALGIASIGVGGVMLDALDKV